MVKKLTTLGVLIFLIQGCASIVPANGLEKIETLLANINLAVT